MAVETSHERNEHGTLIIGACQSGVQLASTLRSSGYTAPITVVGAESHAPYQRPPLSKAFLQGEATAESLIFRTETFYTEQLIDMVLNERITGIEKNDDGSGVATSASGKTFLFDRLALTVGARARKLPVDGAELDGVLYLRDADDATVLKTKLESAQHVIVIGGGFIGLEAAASARKLGKDVHVVEVAPRLIGRAVGEVTSEFFLAAHRRRGLDITLDAKIERLVDDGSGHVSGIELADGAVLEADVVLVGIGVIPRTELAEGLGLQTENGIVVDGHSIASDGTTVAAGDCANLPNPLPRPEGPERVRLESVNNAVEQAKSAAGTLAGNPQTYRTVPWFWSDQFDLKLQIAGVSTGYDQVITRGDPDSEKFAALYYHHGRLIAADCVNSPLDFMAVKSALGKGMTVPAADAADTSVPLKKLVTALEGAPA